MKLNKIKPEHRKVLREIQDSVPKEWTDAVTKRESIAPVTKEILERALEDDDVDEVFKKKARIMLDSGFFNQKIDSEDTLVAELIDAYIEKEMLKKIISKQLPKPKQKQNFEEVYKRFTNLKQQYENRSNKES